LLGEAAADARGAGVDAGVPAHAPALHVQAKRGSFVGRHSTGSELHVDFEAGMHASVASA
jgi:hypothetical protein